jgi:CheY-like chemotaxis protein
MFKETLLWIDDYEPGLAIYCAVFEKHGFRVITAARPGVGIGLAASGNIDVAIVDYEMPGMDGGAVAVELKRRDPQLPVILFTGSTMFPDRLRHVVDGICDKAEPIERLLSTVKSVIAKKSPYSLQQPGFHPSSEQAQSAIA